MATLVQDLTFYPTATKISGSEFFDVTQTPPVGDVWTNTGWIIGTHTATVVSPYIIPNSTMNSGTIRPKTQITDSTSIYPYSYTSVNYYPDSSLGNGWRIGPLPANSWIEPSSNQYQTASAAVLKFGAQTEGVGQEMSVGLMYCTTNSPSGASPYANVYSTESGEITLGSTGAAGYVGANFNGSRYKATYQYHFVTATLNVGEWSPPGGSNSDAIMKIDSVCEISIGTLHPNPSRAMQTSPNQKGRVLNVIDSHIYTPLQCQMSSVATFTPGTLLDLPPNPIGTRTKGVASLSGSMGTAIKAKASMSSAASMQDALSTTIACRSSASGLSQASASLSVRTQFAASASSQASYQGNMATAIKLSAVAAAYPSSEMSMDTEIVLSSEMYSSSVSTLSLDTSIDLALGAGGIASGASGSLATEIAARAVMSGVASVRAMFDKGIDVGGRVSSKVAETRTDSLTKDCRMSVVK